MSAFNAYLIIRLPNASGLIVAWMDAMNNLSKKRDMANRHIVKQTEDKTRQ